jgi:hypothetical protein
LSGTRSKALHRSARGITTDLGAIPGCITSGRDRESHKVAHNWPSVIRVRGGFGQGLLYMAHCALASTCGRLGVCRLFPPHRQIGAAGFWVKRVGCYKARFGGSCFGGRMTRPSPPNHVGELQIKIKKGGKIPFFLLKYVKEYMYCWGYLRTAVGIHCCREEGASWMQFSSLPY